MSKNQTQMPEGEFKRQGPYFYSFFYFVTAICYSIKARNVIGKCVLPTMSQECSPVWMFKVRLWFPENRPESCNLPAGGGAKGKALRSEPRLLHVLLQSMLGVAELDRQLHPTSVTLSQEAGAWRIHPPSTNQR